MGAFFGFIFALAVIYLIIGGICFYYETLGGEPKDYKTIYLWLPKFLRLKGD